MLVNFLLLIEKKQYNEIIDCIKSIDANKFLKISADKARLGKIFYSQSGINSAVKLKMNEYNWSEEKIDYFVTGDEDTTWEIIHEVDKIK